MIEAREDAGLAVKLLLCFEARGIVHARAEQDFLDRAAAAFQAQVFSFIDRAHAAGFDRFDDFVPFAQNGPRLKHGAPQALPRGQGGVLQHVTDRVRAAALYKPELNWNYNRGDLWAAGGQVCSQAQSGLGVTIA
jgi:hypothetical protein